MSSMQQKIITDIFKKKEKIQENVILSQERNPSIETDQFWNYQIKDINKLSLIC